MKVFIKSVEYTHIYFFTEKIKWFDGIGLRFVCIDTTILSFCEPRVSKSAMFLLTYNS